MKRKLLHTLFVLAAFLTAIPIANAAASDYKINAPTKNWTTTFTIPDDNSRQLAISKDGVPYTLSETDKFSGYVATYRITSSGNQLVNLGWTSTGAANAFDDAGNYVTHSAGTSGPTQTVTTNPASKYCVREAPNSTTATNGVFPNGSGVAMNGYTAGKVTLYLDATGDVRHGNGYIWFAQTGTSTNITCLVIKNVNGTPTVSGTKSFNTGIVSGGGNDNYLNFYDTSNESAMKCLLQVRGVGIYDVTLNATAGTVTSVNAITCTSNAEYNSLGAHIFMMRGRKLLCRNTRRLGSDGAARNKYSEFEILDITDSYTNPTKIATIDHLPGKYSNGSSIGNGHQTGSFIQSYKHSEDKVEIFAYVQGSGCSSYFITASAITNPVTSLSAALVSGTTGDVKVSWANPSAGNPTKYAVSYSTNGGTSWSTEVETTNLNYTYSNLADGTYTFKVRAYYGGSSTWGQTATSNSVTIVNYTDPVTNMQVQTGSGMPYSAIVNWAAPSGEGVPTKYAVSYSTNGGSSWSTAVETTSLTHIYTGLAQGEYIFKVTPYYGSTAGEATTKTATVYGVTTPVPAVNVAYYNNTGNCITVSWTAPEGTVAPEKYQVSYSSNGGSSWSAADETTDLTYVYSNLPLGTYTFKVTPVYNGVAGEAALSEDINSLAPTGYTFTTSKRWEVSGTWGTDAVPDGRSIAVSNNMMYVASPNTDTKIAYISQGTSSSSWPNFETGFAKQTYGLAMDNDDVGNIIMSSGTYFGSSGGFAQFTIYPAGATSNASKVDIALEGDYLPGSRCDFIAAQGNLLSSAGGYVWLAPNTGQKIMRIKIANGALAGITTWTQTMSSTTNTNQIVLRPLDDGRLYFHLRGSGYKIITLPAAGEEITADMVETIPATGYAYNPYSNVNSEMFTLLGYTFHVRNDGAEAQSIGVEIKNLTDTGNGDAAFTPFEGITPAGGTSSVTKIAGYGSLVRAVNVDEYTTDVYCYTINHGVTVYRVTASPVYTVTGAIKSLDYEYTKTEVAEGTRQDIILTWTAPEEATPSSYKIYRGGSLLATVDAATLSYTDKKINKNYTYKVVPIFAGTAENDELGREVTTTEVVFIMEKPLITEIRNYDGYSLVELFYKTSIKPVHMNLYRDGKLIQAKLQSYNTLDESLVRSSETTVVKYEIEAVYEIGTKEVDGVEIAVYDSIKSNVETVTIAPRDWAKTGYILQEIYNVPIDEIAAGNKPELFDNTEYYRQGHFKDGHWYIAERSDALSKKDQDKANGNANSQRSEIESDDATATGGVVVFGATNENDVRNGMTGKVIANDAFESVGLAMDDKGTIFVRNNNLTKLAATAPNDGNPIEILKYPDGFTRRITEGALYTRKDDGTYSETPAIIDLSALWTDDRFIDDMVFTSGKSNGQVAGRSDYYHMYGDVMSAEGGYLILSPSWTRAAFKVKIENGEYVSHEAIEFDKYEHPSGNYVLEPTTGAENYGFKLDGRDAVTMQIRSNGYFGIHSPWSNNDWHPIFTADSRINNAGGTSIQAFGKKVTQEMIDNGEYGQDDLGRHTGELFVITPQSMHSKNVGDFLVSRATKDDATDFADEGTLMPSAPVAMKVQTDARSNSEATNANGNWFHAEKGTYASAMSDADECVDIYQYVPGTRFARYRLVPSNQFPQVQPTLEITTAYNDGATEITHFDGVATWQRPAGFGRSTGSANAKVVSYLFEMYNSKNELVAEAELPELYKTDGTPVDDDYEYDFDYNDTTSNVDIDFGRYSVSVRVKYQTKDGLYHISDPLFAEDIHDYTAVPAQDLAVHVFKQANSKYSVENPDGTYSTVTVDNYRVELDFNAANGTEPVTHYTIRAARTAGGVVVDTIDVTDFQLHNGMKVVNGIEQANYVVASEVPGTYDFRLAEEGGSKAPYYHKVGDNYGTGGQSRQQSVLTWHHRVAPGTYGSTNARNVTIDEPSKWIYYVDANYAAKNRYIAKSAPNTISTQILVETGVEVVGNDVAGLKIYPIPATTAITIKSPVAINSIVIYNEAGAEVMTAQGYDETIVEVNIENLATGYYFVKVDGNAPVKIVKK